MRSIEEKIINVDMYENNTEKIYRWAFIEDWRNYFDHFSERFLLEYKPCFIYNETDGFIYDQQWNIVKLDYVPEFFDKNIMYPYSTNSRASFYKGRGTCYFPLINRVSYDLSIEVDPVHLVLNGEQFLLNGKKYVWKLGKFRSSDSEILVDDGIVYENMISLKRSRLSKISKICKNICQNSCG